MLGRIHNKLVFGRRVQRLAAALVERLPQGARVLDVGCGSGDLAALVMRMRPDLRIEGIDVLVRQDTAIPVTEFDGEHIPFPDNSFDAAIVVDVLHHTDDPQLVLAEIARVAPIVIIKDHLRDGPLARLTLRFMDWVGNAAHGVRLPYNYLSRREWTGMWQTLGMQKREFATKLSLYPRPFSWVFDRGLHFVTIVAR